MVFDSLPHDLLILKFYSMTGPSLFNIFLHDISFYGKNSSASCANRVTKTFLWALKMQLKYYWICLRTTAWSFTTVWMIFFQRLTVFSVTEPNCATKLFRTYEKIVILSFSKRIMFYKRKKVKRQTSFKDSEICK